MLLGESPANTCSSIQCTEGPPDIAAYVIQMGLLFATPTTLLVVPYLFAMPRKGNDGKQAHGVFEEFPNERPRSTRNRR